MIKASIVIPTYNRYSILLKVLQYYCCQDTASAGYEVVVVDDGSEDNTGDIFSNLCTYSFNTGRLLTNYKERIMEVRRGWYKPSPEENRFLQFNPINITYVKIKKLGRSGARNIGVSIASFPLIIFADDDIFVESSFIKKHVLAHGDGDRVVIMGKVINTQDLNNPFSARWKLKDINTAFLSTGNASLLKEYIVRAGMFDEEYRLYGWEDFDLGIHLKQMGLKSVKKCIYGYHYDPPAQSLNPSSVYKKEKERGFSAVYFYQSHPVPWVRRFTMVESRVIRALFHFLGYRNWFLSLNRIRILKGFFRLVIRYKGYFDGIEEGKKHYFHKKVCI